MLTASVSGGRTHGGHCFSDRTTPGVDIVRLAERSRWAAQPQWALVGRCELQDGRIVLQQRLARMTLPNTLATCAGTPCCRGEE